MNRLLIRRSYYLDNETGLCYLNSRYYDAHIGRFLTPDSLDYLDPETINGLNLYAYCGNNPVMRVDNQGTSWWSDFWNSEIGNIASIVLAAVVTATAVALFAGVALATGGIGGAALMAVAMGVGFGAVSGGVSSALNDTSIAGGILSGAIKGGATGAAVGLGIMTGGGAFSVGAGFAAFGGAIGANFAAGMASYAIENSMNGRATNWKDALASGGMQALSGVFAFGAGAFIGATGFYNVPKVTKVLSAQWLGNIALGQFVKLIFYYPLSYIFGYLQKSFFSGGNS